MQYLAGGTSAVKPLERGEGNSFHEGQHAERLDGDLSAIELRAEKHGPEKRGHDAVHDIDRHDKKVLVASGYFSPGFSPAASRTMTSRRRLSLVSWRLAESIQRM